MLGGILSAVGSIFGGLLGKSSADKNASMQQQINQQNIAEAQRAQERNIQAAQEASSTDWSRNLAMYGVDAARQDNLRAADLANAYAAEQRAHAYEDTKLQRLVADAKQAGIHPLAALGSNAASYLGSAVQPTFDSPVQSPRSATQAGSGSPGQASFTPIMNPMGDAVANAFKSFADMMEQSSQNRLNDAQIRNLDAQTAATLAQSTSRSLISRARSAAQGGPGSPHTASDGPLLKNNLFGTPSDLVAKNYDWLVSGPYGALRYIADSTAWLAHNGWPVLKYPNFDPKIKSKPASSWFMGGG